MNKRRQVSEFITAHRTATGKEPTLREIGQAFGITKQAASGLRKRHLVTLATVPEQTRQDAMILACVIRDGIFAELARQGLLKIPETMAEEDLDAEQWWCDASEVAEHLAALLRRAGVPDERSDACKAVLAELA
jgi:hypothetical protein